MNTIRLLLMLCTMSLSISACYSKKTGMEQKVGSLISERKDINIANETFAGTVNFINPSDAVMESGGVYRQNVAGAVSFRKCIFKADVLAHIADGNRSYLSNFAQQVNFDSCVFYGKVDFRGSTINGLVNFRNCAFLSEANFEELQCMSNAWFVKCHFDGEARFHNAYFNRKTNFMEASFDSTTSFQSSFFNQEAQFSVTKYWQYADFSLCQFNQGVFFNYAVFHKRTLFNNSSFRDRAEFLRTDFKKDLQMKECKFFGGVKFNDMAVAESFDLEGSVFFMEKPEMPSVNAPVKTGSVRFYTGASIN